ncbi:PQQ-binding-like beta-propeller repeat protein [Bremerella sp. P1]|uniref:PQQ-binding-like beta-propeller repeat protein n=1 Tax=Bremerella sp. P1 TaxID=3026424 RepID=UPI00236808C5|nr:PQQ-binding-like beta-propeller repeat protein [Bremerella sp. P1]WDI41513.1 PQQ-binding-like beta-propeller repeat protein [Bremerella sp. P1]
MKLRILAALFVLVSLSQFCIAENYPQFRGADSNAISAAPLPITWSDEDGTQTNIRWKIPLQGEGWSQPIVWDNRVFLTAAVPSDPNKGDATRPESNNGGYGRDRNDLVNVNYHFDVVCINGNEGDVVWRKTVKTGKPTLSRHSTNTYSTETPVTDGRRIYVYFGMNGVFCLDMEGNLLWQKDLGVYEMRAGWGTASSPTLLNDRLFVQVDNQEQSFLVALDTKTGNEVWRVNRDESSQYSSPFIWKNSLRNELIVGGMIYRSYDPSSGKLLWQIDMNKGRSSATPVAIGDRLFIGNEFRNRGGDDDGGGRLYAIKPGGSGDITPPDDGNIGEFVQWRMDESGIQMASPTYLNGNLYFFERRLGVVRCVDAESGKLKYRSRVGRAPAFWASPWSDGQYVYAMDSNGNTYVISAGDELEVVSVNELDQQAWGTPALADGRIYLRTVDHLYCISKED